jgi:iron(III) transport system ATP-binding protein
MPDVAVNNLTKRFGENVVLDDVTFTVADGELFTLLGPSGCGKTTTLLSIAGFVKPDHGSIACGELVIVDSTARLEVPAEGRNLGMVFQSYALWPHMTVAENVAFPLEIRRAPKDARRAKVSETLELVELTGLEHRYPHELSGGQRQRVALARALVYEPSVLLLDEPFSNLDAKLRERARSWLKRIQHQLGLTTVFVTHDQDEAMEMSDRILVMDRGCAQQIGTPETVYRVPANRFVASFVGKCNFLDGVMYKLAPGGAIEVQIGHENLRLLVTTEARPEPNSPLSIAIRPEAIRLMDGGAQNGSREHPNGANVLDVSVDDVTFLGDHYEYSIRAGDINLVAQSPQQLGTGSLKAAIDPDSCVVVSAPVASLGVGGQLQ